MSYKEVFPNKKKSKRTGKTTFAMVGFAPTTRNQAPWDDPDTIIMGINEAYVHKFMKRWDVWMQMHSQRNFLRPDNENDKGHRFWLQRSWSEWTNDRKDLPEYDAKFDKQVIEQSDKTEFPIIMQRAYSIVPNAVEFPLQEAKELVPRSLREHNGGRYFTSSAAYMIAWALVEGFERIEIYGFEMASDTEYFNQRACFEFWLGLAGAMGREVYLPPICGILKDKMYGYEKMSVGFEQSMEMMEKNLEGQSQQGQWHFHRILGHRDQTQLILEGKLQSDEESLKDELKRLETELEKQQNVLMQLEGAKKQQSHVLSIYRTYPFEEDEGDFTKQEIEAKLSEGTGSPEPGDDNQ